jgi:hypothetical protein
MAAVQFVRKLSATSKPSKVNEAAFQQAVEQIAAVAGVLLGSLVTSAPAKDREAETAKSRARAVQRFGSTPS